jgi:hypothetical protein
MSYSTPTLGTPTLHLGPSNAVPTRSGLSPKQCRSPGALWCLRGIIGRQLGVRSDVESWRRLGIRPAYHPTAEAEKSLWYRPLQCNPVSFLRCGFKRGFPNPQHHLEPTDATYAIMTTRFREDGQENDG